MKIAVGLFYLECNTFNPDFVTKDNFIFAEGEEMLPYIHVCDIFEKAGFEILPTIMASTLPAGRIREVDFWYFANKILNAVRAEKDLDGIWLHLHGAMEVENIGSGDLRIIKELRQIVGEKTSIAITLDAHANNDATLSQYVNIIRGYHTIPHSDQPEAERVAARALVDCIQQKQTIKPALITIPAIISGEKGLTAAEPLKGLIASVDELEKLDEVCTATIFMGDPWADCPNSHLSAVVVPSREEHAHIAEKLCRQLAEKVMQVLNKFEFEVPALEPGEAVERALSFDQKPVFITDSGDNTTGGAVGEGTELLRLLLLRELPCDKKILITAIHDNCAFNVCAATTVGEPITVSVGTGRDETSVPVQISGTLKCHGKVLGYLNCDGDECGSCYTVSVGALDVVISDAATSFITTKHFVAAGTPLEEYDIVILKQGYLFAELRPLAKLAMMAVTKGATYQFIEKLDYKRLIRPIFPLERDVRLDT